MNLSKSISLLFKSHILQSFVKYVNCLEHVTALNTFLKIFYFSPTDFIEQLDRMQL